MEPKKEEIPLPSKANQVSAHQDNSKKNNNGRTKKQKSKTPSEGELTGYVGITRDVDD